jgi:hypothetical protein
MHIGDYYRNFPLHPACCRYPLVSKLRQDEVPNAVLTLINLLGTPKRIKSDNASEYSLEAMNQIYRTHNILHWTTTPYTPYRNDKVENGIGLINTLIRTMWISCGLTKSHWYMTVRYATYIANKINLCPSKKHTVTCQEYYKARLTIKLFLGY